MWFPECYIVPCQVTGHATSYFGLGLLYCHAFRALRLSFI